MVKLKGIKVFYRNKSKILASIIKDIHNVWKIIIRLNIIQRQDMIIFLQLKNNFKLKHINIWIKTSIKMFKNLIKIKSLIKRRDLITHNVIKRSAGKIKSSK